MRLLGAHPGQSLHCFTSAILDRLPRPVQLLYTVPLYRCTAAASPSQRWMWGAVARWTSPSSCRRSWTYRVRHDAAGSLVVQEVEVGAKSCVARLLG